MKLPITNLRATIALTATSGFRSTSPWRNQSSSRVFQPHSTVSVPVGERRPSRRLFRRDVLLTNAGTAVDFVYRQRPAARSIPRRIRSGITAATLLGRLGTCRGSSTTSPVTARYADDVSIICLTDDEVGAAGSAAGGAEASAPRRKPQAQPAPAPSGPVPELRKAVRRGREWAARRPDPGRRPKV